MVTTVFSVPAFFLVLREVLEACLVIGLSLAYLRKVGATHLNKFVWWGASIGISVSLTLGIAFAVVFYTQGNQIFEDEAEKIFEGIVFLVAAGLLTWMLCWIAAMGNSLQHGLEQRLSAYVEQGGWQGKWGLFSMVLVHTLREGIETFIFLFGATQSGNDPDAWRGIPLPGVLAILIGVALSYALFRGMIMLDLLKMLFWSSVILIAFAAGLTSHGFHELQEANWFGVWGENVNARPWWNASMWSMKGCCHDKRNQFFGFLRTLFGYQDTPTFIEWSTYWSYWIVVFFILVYMNWQTIRDETTKVASLTKKFLIFSFSFSFIGFVYTLANVTWFGTLSMTLALLLSFTAMIFAFDVIALRIPQPSRGAIRRPVVLGLGICTSLLTLFMASMHIAQMACSDLKCGLGTQRFYYLGLFFTEDWAFRAREAVAERWNALAVLSWSLTFILAVFGGVSFLLIMFSLNLDKDGNYNYDVERVKSHDEFELDTDAPDVPEPMQVAT